MSSADLSASSFFSELVAERRAGETLPRAFYVDPRVWQRDLDRVFLGGWLLAGHASSVPRIGDYFLYDVGPESIIIARGEQNSVHALANVCRHRGSRVCIEEYGHANQFVCPYHRWAYANDGRLLASPGCNGPVDDGGLVRLAARVVQGLIFICGAQEPPSFDAVATGLERLLGSYDLARTRIAYHRRYLCPANWKLAAENLVECMHLGAAHEECRKVFSHAETNWIGSSQALRAHDEFESQWRINHQVADVESSARQWGAHVFFDCRRLPIRPGYRTMSADGRLIAPLLGNRKSEAGEADGGVSAAQVQSAWVIAADDHAVLLRYTPIEAQVTEFDVTWLVDERAVEGVDFVAENLTWLWRATIEKNLKVCTDNQLGINSRSYRQGKYCAAEAPIRAFIDWYLEKLAPQA